MLNREAYLEWAKSFATMHGFVFETDVLMLGEWFDVLGHYSLEELDFARIYIARATTTPTRKEEYRSLIHKAVNQYRADKHQQIEEAESYGTCANCGGCGLMVVPHVKCVSRGEWIPPYAEMGVTCNCRAGVLRRQSYTDEKRGWSIERYDAFFPGWRRAQVKMRAQWKAEQEAVKRERKNKLYDPLKDILDRLKTKFAGREPGCDEE